MIAVKEVRLIDANALAHRVRQHISIAGKDTIVEMIEEEPTASGSPCDLCAYDPPSSFGGKPCPCCPARPKECVADA